jgi:hypothetical protein
MSGQYLGTIRYWNLEKQFGFAVTDEGQEFYIGAGHLAGRSNLEGTRIRFDRQVKRPDDAWTQKLNDGRLRDANVDPRNPRKPRHPREKPAAANVVIDPSDPGGRPCPDPVSEPGI